MDITLTRRFYLARHASCARSILILGVVLSSGDFRMLRRGSGVATTKGDSVGFASEECLVLLLAGGDGVRLQELTCEITGAPIPKQYCPLLCGFSLLEDTILRARFLAPSERINVVVNHNHLNLARRQLRWIPKPNILVQPINRDTGPGMIFALSHLARTHPDATVVVFPTDHYIDKNETFVWYVRRTLDLISRTPDKVALVGIAPSRPETGYGYIIPAPTVRDSRIERGVFHVKAFREKPNLAEARDLVSGGALWNTFVMVFKLSRMMQLLREIVPGKSEELSGVCDSPDKAVELYRTLTPWNFSRQLLALIPQHLIVVEVADVNWSDWGTRESVERTYKELNVVPFWEMPNQQRLAV